MPVSFSVVTGATGFVGRALCALLEPGRHAGLALGADGWEQRVGDAALEGATIFHLAARVHDPGNEDEQAFMRDNAAKTRYLADEAARRGARRLVFLSSIKVHGDESQPGRPLQSSDAPMPRGAYACSKLAAERALAEVSARTGLEVVTVRAPLVLGAGARGNLASLLALADSPWPLPLASIRNRRSLVHVNDLARLLAACGEQPEAVGATFLAAHPRAASTPALVASLRRGLGRPERIYDFPPRALEALASAVGQGERVRRLTRSLEADASPAHDVLGWRPAIDFEVAAGEMARAWRQRRE
jgi:nucleoside-diphosphate-sugar epimerase